MEKLVIIGNGPAGLTAAIYASRANLRPVVYSGSMPGGLLTTTTTVENFPGFPDGVGGFDLVMAMQTQAEKFGARIEYDSVDRVELADGGVQKIVLDSGDVIQAEALIFATGASPRYLGLPAEERLRGHGVSACATCDGAFYKDVPVVVVGGGDSAMEEALFLKSFGKPVQILGGVLDSERPEAVANGLILGITDLECARKISNEAVRQNRTVECHFKLDTGMGRLGILARDAEKVIPEILKVLG